MTDHIDMIVWYDIDNGASTNSRPDHGWFNLYPDIPAVTTCPNQHRSATSLLGTYDQMNESVARQHLYWLAAAGFDALACDWTNYKSYRISDPSPDYSRFCRGLYRNTEALLRAAHALRGQVDYAVPKVYAVVRLNGKSYGELADILEDVDTLYRLYPDEVYHFNGSDKPFVEIFVGWDEMAEVAASYEDDRFDIRFSNGFITDHFQDDGHGRRVLSADRRMWLFVEQVKAEREGYYVEHYIDGVDGRADMMVAWASLWRGWDGTGTGWGDSLNSVYDDLSPIERTTQAVAALRPRALLVCRFNYPMAWLDESQEGIGLYESTHFEPCRELGFSVFHRVAARLHELNGQGACVPAAPAVRAVHHERLFLTTAGFPLEVALSSDGTFAEDDWQYVDTVNGIDLTAFPVGPLGKRDLWVKTRNESGESLPVCLTV